MSTQNRIFAAAAVLVLTVVFSQANRDDSWRWHCNNRECRYFQEQVGGKECDECGRAAYLVQSPWTCASPSCAYYMLPVRGKTCEHCGCRSWDVEEHCLAQR